MTALRLLLNIVWVIFGGVWMAAAWLVAGVVGLPGARAAFNIALYTLRPCGRQVVPRD